MKEIVKYWGKVVDSVTPPKLSYVTLKDQTTGQVIRSNAVSEKLIAAKLQKDDEFEVIVQQSLDGFVKAHIRKLEPIKLTRKQLDEIEKQVDEKLGVEMKTYA